MTVLSPANGVIPATTSTTVTSSAGRSGGKTIYLLNIGNYQPDITALTYPLIEFYAKKIGASIHVISERKFPSWDMDYEKLQIYELSRQRGDDWAIYIDSDALVYPDLPDVTAMLPRNTVAHHGVDLAPIRFRTDEYFRRDGRHIGSCNWFAVASSWCRDLWRPLDDMTMDQAAANIVPLLKEKQAGVTREHLVSDYALSRNIARFGLKCTTLLELWKNTGLEAGSYFWHDYVISADEKLERIRKTLKQWQLLED